MNGRIKEGWTVFIIRYSAYFAISNLSIKSVRMKICNGHFEFKIRKPKWKKISVALCFDTDKNITVINHMMTWSGTQQDENWLKTGVRIYGVWPKQISHLLRNLHGCFRQRMCKRNSRTLWSKSSNFLLLLAMRAYFLR